jgi:hypothetical protein
VIAGVRSEREDAKLLKNQLSWLISSQSIGAMIVVGPIRGAIFTHRISGNLTCTAIRCSVAASREEQEPGLEGL